MPQIDPNEIDQYKSNLNGEWFGLKNHGDIARVQFMMDSYADLPVFVCHKVKVGDKDRYVNCPRHYNDPLDDCPLCAAGLKAQPVSFVVMFQHDDEKVKIWERGKEFLARLQGLCNRYNPISDYVFEIERNGKVGDKKTTYNVYTMDQVQPFDLSEIEKPEFLGGLILDKTLEEMDIYLQTGEFPDTEEGAPVQTPEIRRRAAPAGAPAQQQSAPARRTPAQAPAQEPSSRATRQTVGAGPASGASRRGAPQGGSERY